MTNNDTLNVWYDQVQVGQLYRDLTGKIGFQYQQSWTKDGFAISQQLPLSIEEYKPVENIAHRFFVNLLPEANARMHIVRELKITDSDFNLLKAIGGECAGALSILPVEDEPRANWSYKQLSHEELHKILKRKGYVTSFTSEKNRPRLSLAGAQDKCPIYFDGNHYFLPHDAAPSTHILKFEITEYRHVPTYEYFLSKLAKSIDLPTVDCQLKKWEREHYLLIKRYDRVMNDDKNVQRLHQEDFCQALGIGYENKYQQDEGPTFHDCYKLIERVSTKPIEDAENLLRWQMFNLLAGNSDGHAKNLALLYDENQQVHLAPFYDLVCTRAIDHVDTKLALSIGGEYNPGKIKLDHWARLAQDCDINEQYVRKTLHQMAESLLDNITVVRAQFENQHGPYPALQRIQIVVTKQCRKTLQQVISKT